MNFFCILPADIDECETGTHTCDSDTRANCTNTIGSYNCACLPGFYGDGSICTGKNVLSVLQNAYVIMRFMES